MTGVSALQTGQRLCDLLTLHTHSHDLTHFVERILFVQRAYVTTRDLNVQVPEHDCGMSYTFSGKQHCLFLCIGTNQDPTLLSFCLNALTVHAISGPLWCWDTLAYATRWEYEAPSIPNLGKLFT